MDQDSELQQQRESPVNKTTDKTKDLEFLDYGKHLDIKMIEHASEHITFTKRILRELRILRHLRHQHLVVIKNPYFAEAKEKFDDVYVVSELMEAELASSPKSLQALPDRLVAARLPPRSAPE